MKVETPKKKKITPESSLVTVCVDLSKSTFHVVGLDTGGNKILRKKFNREGFRDWLARTDLPRVIVAMEACGGAQWWGTYCQSLGHTPKLIPPHQVKPYATSQKNDYNDAEAIGEAALRPKTTSVPVKTPEQQDLSMLIAARQGMIKERTALAARIRAFLLERGFALPQGISHLGERLSTILDEGTNTLTIVTRTLIRTLQSELSRLSETIGEIETMMNALVKTDETSRRLQTIPGIGPMVSASLVAVIGNPKRFRNGRDMAAFLGLVPSQHTSGDKIRLGRITKHGDTGLRSLLVEGAQSAIRAAEMTGSGKMKDGKLRAWVLELKKRKDTPNKVAVALANKMVRMAWAIWTKGTTYTAAA
jgi:transposase